MLAKYENCRGFSLGSRPRASDLRLNQASMQTVFLLIRKTTNWEDEKAFFAQLSPSLLPKVEAWNRIFRMPYHMFRQAIRDIALQNHGAIDGVVLADWENIPTGAIVLPSDDDDWFSTDVARRVAETMAAEDEGVLWTQSVLEQPINFMHGMNLRARKIMPWVGPKWLCSTNNYAFRKSASADSLVDHMGASRGFGTSGLRAARIADRLSIHNRTLASITSLGFGKISISGAELRRKADAYRKTYNKPSLPEGLEWTQPYVQCMAELMASLTLR